jgi:ribosomal protein S18 acetylase RimI-like enzyme
MNNEVVYTLRTGTDADLEFALELNRLSMLPYLAELPEWTEAIGRAEMERRWAADQYQIILVDGERAGMLAQAQRDNQVVLKHIELMPEYQGRGIGSAVIRDVIEQARSKGLSVTLHVLKSNPARGLYERLGFRVVEEVDTGWRGVKFKMVLKRTTDW